MAILPIVERELRVAARRPGTYWTRCVAAGGVMALWLVLLMGSRSPSSRLSGHDLLNALGILALGACMFAGVFLTSDSLSQEKREGTIGLLFLTDLKSYDVVLGKMAAASIHACLGLLATVPVLGLPLLMGGVSGAEFGRVVLVLLVTLFFSLGLGTFVSSASYEAKHSMGRALFLVILFAGLSPMLWWLQSLLFKTIRLNVLLFPSAGFAWIKAFDAHYATRGGAAEFWISLATIGGLGLAGIVGAMVILPRMWSDDAGFGLRHGFWFLRRASRAADPTSVHSPVPITGNPYYWLIVRDPSASKIARSLFWILIPLWLVFLSLSVAASKPVPGFIICLIISFGLHVTLKILIASESSRRVCEDAQSGVLELLLVTPLPPREIMEGHRAALKSIFKMSIGILASVNMGLLYAVVAFGRQLEIQGRDGVIFCELFAGGILMLALDLWALTWAGLWSGLSIQRQYRAMMRTLGKVVLIPWAALFLLIFLQRGFRSPAQAAVTFGLWFSVGAIVDWAAKAHSQKKLEKEFRSAATAPHR